MIYKDYQNKMIGNDCDVINMLNRENEYLSKKLDKAEKRITLLVMGLLAILECVVIILAMN